MPASHEGSSVDKKDKPQKCCVECTCIHFLLKDVNLLGLLRYSPKKASLNIKVRKTYPNLEQT